MSDLKLYNYFRSSTSYRARIALELKNLNYTYVPVHLTNNGGEQNQETYRNLNPMGGLPTLEHNGKFISQSFAIIEYIDEVFSGGYKLLPTDSFQRAKIRQVCELVNADIHPLQNLKVTQFLEKEFQMSAEQKQIWMNKWIGEGITALEKTLVFFAGNFSFGNTPTAADTFLVPQVFSANRFKVDISACETVLKIYDKCQELPAFQKAHPYCQPDTPADLRLSK
jgi:maleylacetoacetate isomerase